MRAVLLLSMLVAGLSAPAARAGPDRVSLLFGSHHIAANSDFEEVNPGVFLTWERRLDYSLGTYRNSYGRVSVAGTVALPVYRRGDLGVALFAGAAWYPEDGDRFAVHLGDMVPLGGVQARWRNLFVQAIPSDGKETAAILSFGLTFPLGTR